MGIKNSNFQSPVRKNFFLSSTCFVHLIFIRKTTVHVALHGMFFVHLCKQSSRLEHVFDSLPDDEHKMFETCGRQFELN
jgi:hypothetical protein